MSALRRLTALVVVLALVALAMILWPGGGTRKATALCPRAVGLFQGSEVRVLGVPVGSVTKVEPQGTRVKVEFEWDEERKVPGDVRP